MQPRPAASAAARRGGLWLRVLFVNPRAYLPQLLGGVETTTFDLVQELARMGHEAAVMCAITKYDGTWLRNRVASRISGRLFPADSFRGTRVYRGYQHQQGLGEVIADFRPDVLVVAGGADWAFDLAAAARATGVPTHFYFHELVALRRLTRPELLDGMRFLANSAYTARAVHELLGRDAVVIPPLVDLAAYRTSTTRRHVTMVNPRRIKGGATALKLAQACPDIPFVFREAWHAHDDFVSALRGEARQLANVTWQSPAQDMLGLYGSTRVLLVPSQWEETWGRVVTECQASGIPALATDYAALPESVGPGGLLVGREEPLEAWISALRRLWDDPALYGELSERARAYAERPEAQPAQRAADF